MREVLNLQMQMLGWGVAPSEHQKISCSNLTEVLEDRRLAEQPDWEVESA